MSSLEELKLRLGSVDNPDERAQLEAEIAALENTQAIPEETPPPPSQPTGPRATPPNVSMTTAPSLEQMKNFRYVPSSNAVATPEQILDIAREWRALGAPANQLGQIAIYLARHCADVGSSEATQLIGNPPQAQAISLQALAGSVKKRCTLRQFCAYYARIIWNLMLQSNTPPASWQKWEFRSSEKFAAFDFFYGVTNEAALMPTGGLIRQPTDAELNAAATASYVNVVRSQQGKNNLSTYAAEVTHAKLGATSQPRILEAP